MPPHPMPICNNAKKKHRKPSSSTYYASEPHSSPKENKPPSHRPPCTALTFTHPNNPTIQDLLNPRFFSISTPQHSKAPQPSLPRIKYP
ncbi:hypothetical protein COCSADRAFT_244167 [Bipolaris sorokiniana ND90Pr]|uniref:Uncharacterized protein n=1 Tax=Cochliobolus sativus (strain ND90Pr / ATCC 201652) TaxID=665912 RepID=M2RZT6_COCSN|nr:uncharacterized protein COCSADRAFT_244167 [Bipolaris sorokiniana ND90Pr]EMD60543.1 hypothetical protein COCSADRAFT_244167 [Bipolaris sorokiniana ND90Pr]